MNRPITLYCAATIFFLILDYAFGVNIRAAFLEQFPLVRMAYYSICFACLALMLWRPGWAAIIGGIESLLAVAALTLSMGGRVMIVTDEMIETGRGIVTTEEILNYLIVAGIAYLS